MEGLDSKREILLEALDDIERHEADGRGLRKLVILIELDDPSTAAYVIKSRGMDTSADVAGFCYAMGTFALQERMRDD